MENRMAGEGEKHNYPIRRAQSIFNWAFYVNNKGIDESEARQFQYTQIIIMLIGVCCVDRQIFAFI